MSGALPANCEAMAVTWIDLLDAVEKLSQQAQEIEKLENAVNGCTTYAGDMTRSSIKAWLKSTKKKASNDEAQPHLAARKGNE